MRVGHKYVADVHSGIDHDVAQHAATMAYRPGRYASPEEFLVAHDQRWVHELHEALVELLDPARPVFGLGSGEGEHEVLLHRAGYEVTATDVVPGVLDDAARLFPGLRTLTLDAFGDWSVEPGSDVVATGMEFYFDDERLSRLMEIVRDRLGPGGRLILVLRYRDSRVTGLIDRVGVPLMARIRRARGERLVRKEHGYRRSVHEVQALAGAAGFRAGRVRYAAFGMEFERLLPAPRVLVAADRRLHVLNSATVLELVAV